MDDWDFDHNVYPEELGYGATVKPIQQTWRDKIAMGLLGDTKSAARQNIVQGLLGSRGMGTTGMGLVDLTPVGVPLAVDETKNDYRSGDYASALINAMSLAPGAKPLSKLIGTLPVDKSEAAKLLLEAITEASGKYKYVGVRTSETPIDAAQRSRVWKNGEPTEKLLSGLSATDATKIDNVLASHGLGKPKWGGSGVYFGDYLGVLGSNKKPKAGEDIAEFIMNNPEVFKQFKRSKD